MDRLSHICVATQVHVGVIYDSAMIVKTTKYPNYN